MKKNLFIILTSTLLILILLYFYNKRELILNKEYLNNNIHIEYPYFNSIEIDKYLKNYLNIYIEDKKRLNSSLFIDYDYFEIEEEKYQLTLYVYDEEENLVRENKKTFLIDIKNTEILEQNIINNTYLDYNQITKKLIDKNKAMIALTFDDGPNHNTNKILNILEKYKIKATFFILGTNIEGNEAVIKRMNEFGMEIGNHTYSHKLLTKLKQEQIIEEIEKVDQTLFAITGKYPTLIRPSYGSTNEKIRSLLNRPIILWNVDTLDWKYHSSKNIYNRVVKHVQDGNIILMHDIYNATANSLELIIPKLLDMGYQFVTISELLYYKDIELENGKVYRYAK